MKSRDGKRQRHGESQKRKSMKRKSEKFRRKGRTVAKHCVFPMFCGSGGSKSMLAKAAGAEPSGQVKDDKVHAVVGLSAFPNQNAKSTTRAHQI